MVGGRVGEQRADAHAAMSVEIGVQSIAADRDRGSRLSTSERIVGGARFLGIWLADLRHAIHVSLAGSSARSSLRTRVTSVTQRYLQ